MRALVLTTAVEAVLILVAVACLGEPLARLARGLLKLSLFAFVIYLASRLIGGGALSLNLGGIDDLRVQVAPGPAAARPRRNQ